MKSVPATLFFRPMNPQPEGEPAPLSEWSRGIASACHDHSPDEDRLNAHTERLRGRIYPFRTKNGGLVSYRQPYRPGEKCYVREAWRFFYSLYRGVDFIAYKSDLTAHQKSARWGDEKMDVTMLENDPYMKPIQWRSPVTMPQWAARRFVVILSCEPVRVEDVTEEDIIKAGLADGSCVWANGAARCNAKGDLVVNQFMDNWHKRHPGKEWAWRVESQPSGITG